MTTKLETFAQYRSLCFAVAYRMLSSVADAEDTVQEAWIRWEQCQEPIEEPKAWLTRVVSRMAIDRLRQRKVREEKYPGPWLPEPVLTNPIDVKTTQDRLEELESMYFAYLRVLEQLNAIERAVFLLRAVFECSYDEIAATVGKNATHCRQLYARAKKKVQETRPRYTVQPDQQVECLRQFYAATQQRDFDAMLQCLESHVELVSDGGGKKVAALKILRGAEVITKFLVGISKNTTGEIQIEETQINHQPGLMIWIDGELDSVFCFEFINQKISRIYIVSNPDKLLHLVSARPDAIS